MPSAVKAKINRVFHEYQVLTAQTKVVIRTRSPARMVHAKLTGGMDLKSPFKVAFVPGTATSKVIWNKDNTLTIREGKRGAGYTKNTVEFDPIALVQQTKAEVDRVVAKLVKRFHSQRFVLMAGVNMRISKPVTAGALYRMVVKLMNEYDGVKTLPVGSGNTGDRPDKHKWHIWMHGVMGFHFDRDPDTIAPTEFYEIEQRHKAQQKDRKNAAKRDEYARKHKTGAYAVVSTTRAKRARIDHSAPLRGSVKTKRRK